MKAFPQGLGVRRKKEKSMCILRKINVYTDSTTKTRNGRNTTLFLIG